MNRKDERGQSRAAKWGWAILIILSALIALQGIGAFFTSRNMAFLEQFFGVSMTELRQSYPSAADAIVLQTANFGILAFAFGLLALVVALKGLRLGSRWAWNTFWLVSGSLVVIVVNEAVLRNRLDSIGISFLALAFIGQLLARSGLSAKEREME